VYLGAEASARTRPAWALFIRDGGVSFLFLNYVRIQRNVAAPAPRPRHCARIYLLSPVTNTVSFPNGRSDPMRDSQMYLFLISSRSPFRKRDRAPPHRRAAGLISTGRHFEASRFFAADLKLIGTALGLLAFPRCVCVGRKPWSKRALLP
jgi:hypothetical protein